MPNKGQPPGAEGPAPRTAWVVLDLSLVIVAASVAFAFHLAAEPPFVDEWAYVSQTYYADLWFEGNVNDPAWLEYPAYDLPPLPKYAIGLALKVAGHPRPGPRSARAWYANTSSRFGPPEALYAARRPSVFFGAIGCGAVYGLGRLAGGRRTGALAALFLMVNPLYRLHARRAMSDVPAEALILVAAVLGLWAWKKLLSERPGVAGGLLAVLAGASAGLAMLAKLSGALALIVVAAWAILAVCLPAVPVARKLAVALAGLVTAMVAVATFAAGNPFLTAHPSPVPPGLERIDAMSSIARARWMFAHRFRVSDEQKTVFPHNALWTTADKVSVVVAQGFGRFGPFGPRHSDSTRRYDWPQDWGALLWLPAVAAGAFMALRRGASQRARGEPPTAWAILVQAMVAVLVVTAYLPLAWDRYFLSLQPVSALLAAVAVAALSERFVAAVPPRSA